jgi:hypothetical protein
MTDESTLLTLKRLNLEFGVDISGAEGLSGAELQAVCERLEDQLFERQMTERRALQQQG